MPGGTSAPIPNVVLDGTILKVTETPSADAIKACRSAQDKIAAAITSEYGLMTQVYGEFDAESV